MGIGTSLGAYYDDSFHQSAAQWNPDKYDDNDMVVTPNQMQQNKEMDAIENNELGGLPISNRFSTPLSAAEMASQASEKAADALKRGQGTKPTSDVDTGIEGKVYYQGKYGSITDKDIDQGIGVALSASGAGVNILKGVPRIGLKPANDNVAGLYNPREPNMIGSKELDEALDASFKQLSDKHEAFIKGYDELHKFSQDVLTQKGGWNEFNVAKYNKMGRDLNPDWLDTPIDPGGLAPEKVTRAAVEHKGSIYEGQNHAEAFSKIEELDAKALKEGFSTTYGRFISREEAMDIAKKQDQIHPDIANEPSNTMLLSEDLSR